MRTPLPSPPMTAAIQDNLERLAVTDLPESPGIEDKEFGRERPASVTFSAAWPLEPRSTRLPVMRPMTPYLAR